MSRIPAVLGRYDESLRLVHTALYSMPGARSNARVRSELFGLEARAYAQLGSGEVSKTVRASEACVDVWQTAAKEPAEGWVDYMNQARVHYLAADAYIELALQDSTRPGKSQHAELAERHALDARTSRGQAYARSRVFDEIGLARVRLAQVEPTEAAVVAQGSLKLAENIRSLLVVDRAVAL